MSPSVWRRSGPDVMLKGKTEVQTPRALVSTCETCGSDYAPFGTMVGGKLETYCGWDGTKPVCKARQE